SLVQWVTLASIIEKETGLKSEMPLVAAVFRNRLKNKMPLQSDPTVIYGIENFDGNLTRRHLERQNPYNSYLNRGLPPGPICSPGLDALRAALNPAPVKYLYFVSRNDGSHHFSETLPEHSRAVRKYQINRKSRGN
ncbi:MAG TPA: endolytic transglycosylase MltG, partial [Syntrophales bacterium]|nr:endolytic transglycosylase MltG [Syntrophales bacterium]